MRCIDFLAGQGTMEFSLPVHDYDSPGLGMFRECTLIATYANMYERGGNLTICGRPFGAVIWINQMITIHAIGPVDAISFDFTGCVMGTYDLGGTHYAVHIHAMNQTSRNTWAQYMTANPGITNLVMFYPDVPGADDVKAQLGVYGVEVMGLITAIGECYTLYVCGEGNDENRYRLLGYKLHMVRRVPNAYAPLVANTQQTNWYNFFEAVNGGRVTYVDDVPGVDLKHPRPRDTSGGCCF